MFICNSTSWITSILQKNKYINMCVYTVYVYHVCQKNVHSGQNIGACITLQNLRKYITGIERETWIIYQDVD